MEYEYRVVPAPRRLRKIKGVRSTPELFATTLTDAINAEARQGWEYVRSESMTAEGPSGWLRRGRIVEETMMIFRRPRPSTPQLRGAGATEPLLARTPAGHDRTPESVVPPLSGAGRTAGREAAPAPVVPGAERNRPAASEARGDSLRPMPDAMRSRTPPLLRPVPRHTPDDRS
ncbi:MAG TPA: DUF4177 domain-containing protein [Paracoccaceae bacterium]|nr:DUF4177 domain-containing protein [Paracoccaceae bacterium]